MRAPRPRALVIEDPDDIPEWLDDEQEAELRQAKSRHVGWGDILEAWGSIEADFHREYGIDLSHDDTLTRYSWRWFTVRLFGLSEKARTWSVIRAKVGTRVDDDAGDIDRFLGVHRDE